MFVFLFVLYDLLNCLSDWDKNLGSCSGHHRDGLCVFWEGYWATGGGRRSYFFCF